MPLYHHIRCFYQSSPLFHRPSATLTTSGARKAPVLKRLVRMRRTLRNAAGFGSNSEMIEEDGERWLPPFPHVKNTLLRSSWNASALAFLGDSVWELYCRTHFFFPPTRLTDYYDNVISHVRAEQQELYYELLTASDWLREEERDILRWGRNAKVKSVPKRLVAAKSGEAYRKATALECLAGFLYLTDPARLHALMVYLGLGGVKPGSLPLPHLPPCSGSPEV
eukprot:jgi/Botrbrau1/5994/Bobra.104_1s0024.1